MEILSILTGAFVAGCDLGIKKYTEENVRDGEEPDLERKRNLPQSPQQRSDDESSGFQTKAGKRHVGGSTWNPVFLGAPSLERTGTQTGKAWNIADAGRSSW